MSAEKFIYGKVNGSYKGINLKTDGMKMSKWDLLLFDLVITDAKQIPEFNIAEIDRQQEKSLMPLLVKNVWIHYHNPDLQTASKSEFRNLYKVIITEVELHDTIEKGSHTYGRIAGNIYAALEPLPEPGNVVSPAVQKGSNPEKEEKPGCWLFGLGCLPRLLLFLLLLLLLYCLLTGKCGCNGCNGTNNEPLNNGKDTTTNKPSGNPGNKDEKGTSGIKDSVNYRGSDSSGNSYDSTQATNNTGANVKRTPKTGLVNIALEWNGRSDLDLYVVTPAGDTVYYSQTKSATGFELDFDANAGSGNMMDDPVEHIYLPLGVNPQKGRYRVYVSMFSFRDTLTKKSVRFTLTIGNHQLPGETDKKLKRFNGEFLPHESKKLVKVTDFEL